jgi:hypothetical protein
LLGARDDGVAPPATARRGERTGATTRGATRENTLSGPQRPRSTREHGTAPHFAQPVMRHQPAHMSRDTDVDDSQCALPADSRPRNSPGPLDAARLTRRTPYECSRDESDDRSPGGERDVDQCLDVHFVTLLCGDRAALRRPKLGTEARLVSEMQARQNPSIV